MIRFKVLLLLKIKSPIYLYLKVILSLKYFENNKMILLLYMDYKQNFFCKRYQAKSKYTMAKSIFSNIIIQKNIKSLY